jgi:AcrR family transcriptional regulator
MATMKEQIKTVAINLFYKNGYFATGMSDIARGAGIQKSSIYYHYSNKEDILVDIFQSTMKDLNEHLTQWLDKAEDEDARMRAAIQSHVNFHIDRQKETIIADSELRGLTAKNYKSIIQMRDDYEKKFQQIIKEGIEKGNFDVPDYKIISYAIITMCTAVCSWFNSAGRLPKETVAGIFADFIITGLKRNS